ncbi:MAG: phosphoribosylglycinamide formyltransferase [Lentimicrobiaceae bacterium]|jgi:phosphoribosylglycinamide formyltransferase-1|nr:phosphoribosylglycinamide formyltransferase [Lentimicrobiaceae bacterium]MCP4910982.1 phosphoribosylglycinamide formyltransferase [Bacteroidota bacterium]MBT3454341.1 phosphoribosylglycinamide formyltransferase [Lentimicrobiaceae bacterium]MBT3817935.1 phosphoribosylglycinamide formyltransferase [Lentimicrobiaceae bacterium]MBT4061559.1 phosphoribosylglycinamide formyltransferase [Lentimicrobiaceae bacterium]
MKNIVIFASGNGTNAERIVTYFEDNNNITTSCIFTNNPKAGVIERANKLSVNIQVFNRDDFYKTERILNNIKSHSPDLIVLAGFLWLIPEYLIDGYNGKIINIHPALLPKFGGKGMYGMSVHKAVIEASEKESGITIHYVNKHYDEGQIIFQKSCKLDMGETPKSLSNKIHELEHKYFPEVINELLKS